MNENLRPQGGPILKRLVIGAALAAASAAAGCAVPTSEVRANLASATNSMVGEANDGQNGNVTRKEQENNEISGYAERVASALTEYGNNPNSPKAKSVFLALTKEGEALMQKYTHRKEEIDFSIGKMSH